MYCNICCQVICSLISYTLRTNTHSILNFLWSFCKPSIFRSIFCCKFQSIVKNAFCTFWTFYITTHLYIPTLYYATPTPLVHNTLTLCLHHSGFVVRGGGVVYLLLCPHVYIIKTSVNSSPVHNITRLHNIKSTLLVLTLLNLSITHLHTLTLQVSSTLLD